jgi:ERCC4-type nuclease
MNIQIDCREAELLQKCETMIKMIPKFTNLKITSGALPLGDIIINDGLQDCIIIERKTFSDLAASIKDGRYKEQSYRLNGLPHHNHNIIYLIEGDITRFNSFKERIDPDTMYSAMFSINYFKGFSVMRSTSIAESASIICNMAYKIGKSTKPCFYTNVASLPVTGQPVQPDTINAETNSSSNETISEKDYCAVIKKVKKDNITIDNIGEIMLCQIPGVSSTTALSILGQYKTLPNLIKSIQENDACLNGICTTDANGKSRKISKSAIATIIKFLKN